MKIRLKVIRETTDHASVLKVGDVVEINMESYDEVLVIGGAHYNIAELYKFFEVVE